MAKSKSFRVGKVRADLRGHVWYLTYQENGRRRRPRVGPNRDAAHQMAAQINAQLHLVSKRWLAGFLVVAFGADIERRLGGEPGW